MLQNCGIDFEQLKVQGCSSFKVFVQSMQKSEAMLKQHYDAGLIPLLVFSLKVWKYLRRMWRMVCVWLP